MSGAVVGVDPGVSGAIAIYWPDDKRLVVHDMPTIRAKRGKTALDVDVAPIVSLLGVLLHIERVVVEQVTSRPRQAGQFAFGVNYGRVLGVIEARGLPLIHVPASKWKQEMGLRGEDKSQSVALAAALFPGCASQFYGPRGAGLDGRAEAALLAFWGSKQS